MSCVMFPNIVFENANILVDFVWYNVLHDLIVCNSEVLYTVAHV